MSGECGNRNYQKDNEVEGNFMEKRTERKIKSKIALALLILGLAAGMTGCGKKETTEPASTTETAATEDKGTENETGKSFEENPDQS